MSDQQPAFRRPNGEQLPPWHHLSLNPRKKYVLRVTVSKDGGKFVGTRIVQQLRTSDPVIALAKRDAVIEGFKLAGLICRDVEMVDGEM